ncbi:oxidoreductase [Subtercola boreus]|uniref:Oxidoreductase n=1 Tax=Subtercola boreus TaxID=120213 RepID=A0A3E0VLT9_9MICO|nr:alcohol dehydrogenase catalytic domain-containing protein [Subtercola boreus]RFA10645.1 oxidoreductase [Subtercola boreus]TQL55798.1 propanol-preferring alcohol dehydrogenase [Subtercola boreus]
MKAIQFVRIGTVEQVEVDKPVIGAGEVLIKVTAAGVCQTDVHFQHATEQMIADHTTLGHEIVGDIVETAPDVTHLTVGEQVIVMPCFGCGVCVMCIAGKQNACRNTGGRLFPAPTPGVSVNGGMAEYVAVRASAVVPAAGLDPKLAAALTDAGLVPFHSINATKDILRPGSTAVVIGVGGLGQFAVEILRAVTGASIIAIDLKDSSLDAVRDKVAHTFRSDDPELVSKILDTTGGYGADVVLDFVGNDTTLALDGHIIAPYGAIRVPGLSDGTFAFETSQTQTSLPWGASITRPYSGTYQDLYDLVALARTGKLDVDITEYAFDDALTALDDLHAGRVVGRAVLVMP